MKPRAAATVLAHRFEGEGEGEVVLFLNGGMMTYAAWEPVAAPLRARSRRLLLCDFRGQLRSPGPAPGELEGHVRDLVALLDELSLAAVHVLGTSFGAEVGLLFAATRPERVLSLAAVTATDHATPELLESVSALRRLAHAARSDPPARGRFQDLLMEQAYSEGFRRRYSALLAERRGEIERLPEVWFIGLEGILTCLEGLDLRPHLGAIRCPTLVVIAAEDGVLAPERARALAAAIAGAEVVEHPASGHALVVEEPGWLADRYLEFLARLGGSG